MSQQPDLRKRLDELDGEREQLEAQLNRERLTEVTGSIVSAISSPAFVERMRKFRESTAAGDVEPEAMGKLFSPEELNAAGANLPKDFRISSRTFEDYKMGNRINFDPGRMSGPGDRLSWGACGGAGGLTFCGCAGGST